MAGIKFASNVLTSLNLFSGFFAIFLAFEKKFDLAFYLIIFGLIFDIADGRIARALRISSKFGVEFDSLADLVTFGIAPSMILYNGIFHLIEFGKLLSFIPALAVAIRLARFNVSVSDKPREYFEGLSSPMGAFALVGPFMLFSDILSDRRFQIIMVALTLIVSALEVSTIRFRSFKELRIRRALLIYFLFIPPIFFWLLIFKKKIFLITTISMIFSYIIYNIVFENLLRRRKEYGKGLHIRHDLKGRRAGAGVLHDGGGKSENGAGS